MARSTRDGRGRGNASEEGFAEVPFWCVIRVLTVHVIDKFPERIGLKPIQSSALSKVTPIQGVLNGQKGSDLEGPRPRSYSNIATAGAKGKGRAAAPALDDDGEDSGDEAEKLDEEQMNEIDSIYRK